MELASSSTRDTDVALGLGHLLVGAAATVFGAVLVITSRAPGAELETVLLGPGLLLAAVGLAFGYAAVHTLRAARDGQADSLSLALSVIELAVGVALAVGVVVAVQGYGVFEPWRSPLLVPSIVLTALGLWGALHAIATRRP